MQGQLQVVQNNKKNTSLRVQIDGQWFSAKFSTGLKPADVGQHITATLDDNEFPPGSGVMWINEYQFQGTSGTPAAQAMDTAMADQEAAAQAALTRQRVVPNKDSLIGALALVKSIRGQKEQVWEAFRWFYHKMDTFDPSDPY